MMNNELKGVNKEVYKTDWQWQEGEYTVTRTNQWTAPGCHNGCSVLYSLSRRSDVRTAGRLPFGV